MYDSLSSQLKQNLSADKQNLNTSFVPTYLNGFKNGLGTYPGLSNTAWRSVLGSEIISTIDFDLRKQLFESYSNLEELNNTKENTLSSMLIFNGNILDRISRPSDLSNFSSRLTDFIIQEKRQIGLNLNILKLLNEHLQDDLSPLPTPNEIQKIIEMSDFGI